MIKAGHTGWNQAGFATQNIMCCIETDALNAARAKDERMSEPELVEYEKTPPQIKVTLGLVRCAVPSSLLVLMLALVLLA